MREYYQELRDEGLEFRVGGGLTGRMLVGLFFVFGGEKAVIWE